MHKPYLLKPHFTRKSTFFSRDDKSIPAKLLEVKSEKPDLEHFPVALPSKKEDYTCFAEGKNDVLWLGAKTGLTRYAPNEAREDDVLMYFSANRDLISNSVEALLVDGDNIWVLCEDSVAYVELVVISPEEKAYVLLEETMKYVDRRGMVSQKRLDIPRDVTSAVDYGHSDNDGGFTAHYAIGEIFHYATLKRELGATHEKTIQAKKVAVRACESCLLLMYIAGRGDGFIARSYVTVDEPMPDDGLFFKKEGDKAICKDTRHARRINFAGKTAPVIAPVPARLAKLYTDLGYTDDDIIYKADTSSDEVTQHFALMYYIVEHLCEDDPELKELTVNACTATMTHIVNNGFEMVDATGEPTSWSKWSTRYFESEEGWVDACLNAAEVLMFLRVTIKVTGDKDGFFKKAYDELVRKGYPQLTLEHYDRFQKAVDDMGLDFEEDLMYGDNVLATMAFWNLIVLEDDPALKDIYRRGYTTWNNTLRCEHNPGYDFPYLLACPDEEVDMEPIATWFYRFNLSRLAAGVSLVGREDIPVKTFKGGKKRIAKLIPPDERFIAKYDRDMLDYRNEDSGGIHCVESCYVYTFAYWIGRYYGFIEEA